MNNMSKDEIRALRDDFNELKVDIDEEIETRRKNSEIKRVENTHILVALAVFGAFTSGLSEQFINSPLSKVFKYMGWFSISFLLLKLTTLSVRPILESRERTNIKKLVKGIDDIVLPIFYIILLYGSFSVIIVDRFVKIGSLMSGVISIEVLFWLEIIVLAVFGYLYGKELDNNMSIESSSRDEILLFPSSTSGSTLEFYIKNTRDSSIPAGDIEFIIAAPDGIQIEKVYPAIKRGDKWATSYSLPSNQRMKISLDVSVDESVENNKEHTIDVVVKFEESIQSKENLIFKS